MTQMRSSYEERLRRMVPAEVKQVCNCQDNVMYLNIARYFVLSFVCYALI